MEKVEVTCRHSGGKIEVNWRSGLRFPPRPAHSMQYGSLHAASLTTKRIVSHHRRLRARTQSEGARSRRAVATSVIPVRRRPVLVT